MKKLVAFFALLALFCSTVLPVGAATMSCITPSFSQGRTNGFSAFQADGPFEAGVRADYDSGITINSSNVLFYNKADFNNYSTTGTYRYFRLCSPLYDSGTFGSAAGFTIQLSMKFRGMSESWNENTNKVGQTGFVINARLAAWNKEIYLCFSKRDHTDENGNQTNALITSYGGNRDALTYSNLTKRRANIDFQAASYQLFTIKYDALASADRKLVVYCDGEELAAFPDVTRRTVTSKPAYNKDFLYFSTITRGDINGNGTEYMTALSHVDLDYVECYNRPLVPELAEDPYAALGWGYVFAGNAFRNISSGYKSSSRPSHAAIDLAGAGISGTAILSPTSGTVKAKYDEHPAAGHYVIVETDDVDPATGKKIRVGFKHMILSSSTLKVNDSIVTGQKVGEVGNTGNSTGPHLDLSMWSNPNSNGSYDWSQKENGINPQRFFPNVIFTGEISFLP